METTMEAPTAAPEAVTPSVSGTSEQVFTDDHAHQLHDIEQRIKEDPDVELGDDDLSLYTASMDGKLKAKARPERNVQTLPDDAPEDIADDPDAPKKPVVKAEEKPSPEIERAMKEVGAKTPAELVDKIQGLRKALTGKDAQTVAQLNTRLKEMDDFVKGEKQLYADAAAGKPEALRFLEARGLKLGKSDPTSNEIPFDPDADALTGGALTKFHEANTGLNRELSDLKRTIAELRSGVETEKQARRQEYAEKTAQSQLIDQMMDVAQFNDELKVAPNLRSRLSDVFLNGKDDAQVTPFFTEVVKTAEEHGLIDLKAAYYILKGKNAEALIEKARREGVRKVLETPANRSLSGVVSSDEPGGIQTVTEAQLEAFEDGNLNALPKSWFNEEGDFVKARVPAKFHGRLGIF